MPDVHNGIPRRLEKVSKTAGNNQVLQVTLFIFIIKYTQPLVLNIHLYTGNHGTKELPHPVMQNQNALKGYLFSRKLSNRKGLSEKGNLFVISDIIFNTSKKTPLPCIDIGSTLLQLDIKKYLGRCCSGGYPVVIKEIIDEASNDLCGVFRPGY